MPRPAWFVAENPGTNLCFSVETQHAHFENDYDIDIVDGDAEVGRHERLPLMIEELARLYSPALAVPLECERPMD